MELVLAASLIIAYLIALCLRNKAIPSSLFDEAFEFEGLCVVVWVAVMIIETFIIGSFLLANVVVEMAYPFIILAIVSMVIVALISVEKSKDSRLYKQYIILSRVAGICSQVIVATCAPIMLLMWIPTLVNISLSGMRWKHLPFLIEVTCFVTIILTCFLMIN